MGQYIFVLLLASELFENKINSKIFKATSWYTVNKTLRYPAFQN